MKSQRTRYTMIVLALLAACIGLVGWTLHTQKAYIPDNHYATVDAERSQVYVSGSGYTIDKQQEKIHKEIEKKRKTQVKKEQAKRKNKRDTESNAKTEKKPKWKDPNPPKAKEPKDPTDPGNTLSDEEAESNLTDEERAVLPVIRTSLVNGDKVKGSNISLWVSAVDHKGRNIPVYSVGDGAFTVICNGTRISSTGESGGKTYFRPDLKEGRNTFTITATDRDQNKRTISRWITADTGTEAEKTGSVHVTISARILGLGTLTSQSVTIHDGDPASEIIKKACDSGGLSVSLSGGYLSAISKNGMVNGWHISDDTAKKLEEKRASPKDPDGQSMNRLKEHDFYNTSGWIYSVNGSFPSVGLNSYVPDDGDEINVYFQLADGIY